jgi:hypothetical protein
MFVFRFTHFQLGAVLATSFIFAMSPRAGYGYTADEQQACTGDAFRLCSSDIPDVDRITACMIRNKSQLSPACRVFFRYGPESEAASVAGTPADIKPVAARKPHAKPHTKPRAKSDAKSDAKSHKTKKPAKPAET